MAYGLRIWDGSGNLILDTSTRVGRVLGVITVSSNGSLVVPGFAQGAAFFITGSEAGTESESPWAWNVDVSVSGTTLSWDFGTLPVAPTTIIYGVY